MPDYEKRHKQFLPIFREHVKCPFCHVPDRFKGLFTWSGGPQSSGVGFFCFVFPRAWKQKKPTPLDRGLPLHVNRPLGTLSLSMFSFVWFGYRPRKGWERLELCLGTFFKLICITEFSARLCILPIVFIYSFTFLFWGLQKRKLLMKQDIDKWQKKLNIQG